MENHKLYLPIPLDEAVQFASNWREFNAANTVGGGESAFPLNEILPNAFTFSLSDVEDILKEEGVCKVRVYFGYDKSTPAPDPEEPMPMRVMLVGVDDQGKDVIYAGKNPCGIYDFATPCPSTCDYTSPMMTGMMSSK